MHSIAPAQVSTRDKIYREAAHLFARRGYGGTSMSEIAERVGIRKASLYNYCESKASLLLELIEESLVDWQEACHVRLPSTLTVEERLAAYLRGAVRFGRDNPQAVGILRIAAGQMPVELRNRVQSILESHDEAWRETLTTLFEEAIERGEVERTDPYELGLFWSVFVHGLLINQIFETEKSAAMLASLQPLWRLFWRGLSGRFPTTEIDL